MSTARIAPGPHGHWLLGNLREFRRDVLGLVMASVHEHGDVVRFRLGPKVVHLLNHPDHVEQVLQRKAANYDKETRSAACIRKVTGESLLTSNGETWRRQRQHAQPFFHRQAISRFAREMTAATSLMLERWRKRGPSPLDLASELMQLTYRIVGRTIFSADVGPDAEAVERAMPVVLAHTFGRLQRPFSLPDWVPTARNRRYQSALRDLDTVVYRIIREHRERDAKLESPNLLSMLLNVRDEVTGAGLSDEELRNETLTLLLAGHETTANALTWVCHLVSQHPAVAEELRSEVQRVLGGREPTLEDVPALTYTKQVIREAMRLYPPIWIIERRVIADDTVGGFHLPAGSAAVIVPYALHRHPAFWDRPEEFDPNRFAQRVPPAYIPFGAGPRFCIGSEFAMMEAQLITAMVVQSFALEAVPGQTVEPWPGITLRTRHGLMMTLKARR
jgi:cytochrome P450